jgi:cytidine deaminase
MEPVVQIREVRFKAQGSSHRIQIMKEQKFEFSFEVYESVDELGQEDQQLLQEARDVIKNAYAPYSNFYVGAAARLSNGKIVTGSNQENASFPVGICAERVLLSSASSLYPGAPIETMAVTYQSQAVKSDHPISPCGMCRQSLQEFESRMKKPIRLILGGMEGKIYVIQSASQLLPLAFTSEELE